MSEFFVAPIQSMNGHRPWRQRRSQNIHHAMGSGVFVEAANREDAVKQMALKQSFMNGRSRTFVAVPMRGAQFFEVEAPLVTIKAGDPHK